MTTLTQHTRQGHAPTVARVRALVSRVDWLLLLACGALSAISLFVIKTATATDVPGQPTFFFDRQLLFVIGGAVAMVVVAAIDPTRLQNMAWVLLGSLLGGLAVVFAIGSSVKGSNRWIDLGPFSLQPSEIGKVLMVVVLAALAVERVGEMEPRRLTILLGVVTGIPALVVFLQPDLGTSLVYFAVYIGVLVMICAPWQHFAVMGAGLAALVLMVLVILPAVGAPVLKDYQEQRLTAFVNPGADAGRTGYQLAQAKIAVGSGGPTGKGVDGATQSTRAFIPEHQTDFIFSVVGEMFGFIGATGVVFLFGVVIWRALRIAARAATQFEQVVAGTVAAMFIFQSFVNIGMNIGIMPVTGIPLPFMSHGGSHTLTNLAAVGLLLAINRRRIGI